MPVYTLQQPPDSCAITAVLPARATLALAQPGDTCVIAAQPKTTATMALSQAADGAQITGTVAFLATAQLPIQAAADSCTVAGQNGQAAVPTTRVLIGDTSEITWLRSCIPLCWVDAGDPPPVDPLMWVHPGADYTDANGVQQGSAHYVTKAMSTGLNLTTMFDVTTLCQALVLDNTGIILTQDAQAGSARWYTKENTSGQPIPALTIVTTVDTYNPTLLGDTWIDASAGSSLASLPYSFLPFILNFDLSDVRGAVTSATLTIVAQQAWAPVNIYVDKLDTPIMLTAPAEQVPGEIELGIASTVDVDSDLEGHPDVIAYAEFQDQAMYDSQKWLGPLSDPHSFVPWSDYGIYALRVSVLPGNNYGVAAYRVVSPPLPPPYDEPYQRPMGAGYDELYMRFLLKIDSNVYAGMNEFGVKQTGMNGTYEQIGMINHDGSYNADVWSARTEHAGKSINNPQVYRLFTYWYGYDNPITSGSGWMLVTNQYGMCLQAERTYSIEQHIRLNTFTGSTPNPDGLLELWVDGVKVFYANNMRMRGDPIIQIESAPLLQIYHGGTGTPTAEINYELSGVVASEVYVGPPKRQWPAWRQGMSVGTFYEIPGTSVAVMPIPAGMQTPLDPNIINGYQGLAAGPHTWYTFCNGGHPSVQNPVCAIDWYENAPAWEVLNIGIEAADLPTAAQCAGPPQVYYYSNGSPAAGQSYSQNQYIHRLNRLMKFGITPPPNPSGSNSRGQVDGFRLTDLQFDPAGTWDFIPFNGQFWWLSMGCAKHPTTEDVYMSNCVQEFVVWRAATQTWQTITTIPQAIFTSNYYCFKGTCIDAGRNRWATCDDNELLWLDISNYTWHSMPIVDAGGQFATNYNYTGGINTEAFGFTHDTDNDRYIISFRNSTIYAMNPTTGAVTLLGTLPTVPINGWNNRAWYFEQLGGILFCPSTASNCYFLPTRADP